MSLRAEAWRTASRPRRAALRVLTRSSRVPPAAKALRGAAKETATTRIATNALDMLPHEGRIDDPTWPCWYACRCPVSTKCAISLPSTRGDVKFFSFTRIRNFPPPILQGYERQRQRHSRGGALSGTARLPRGPWRPGRGRSRWCGRWSQGSLPRRRRGRRLSGGSHPSAASGRRGSRRCTRGCP